MDIRLSREHGVFVIELKLPFAMVAGVWVPLAEGRHTMGSGGRWDPVCLLLDVATVDPSQVRDVFNKILLDVATVDPSQVRDVCNEIQLDVATVDLSQVCDVCAYKITFISSQIKSHCCYF